MIKHDVMRGNTVSACRTALEAMGERAAITPHWRPLRAPGYLAPAPADIRQTADLFDGWTRLTVPSVYDFDPEGDGYYHITLGGKRRVPLPSGPGALGCESGRTLPDLWSPERHHHHAWYALDVQLPSLQGDTLWLRFDAVAHCGTVYVNGRKAGRHLGGYTPFEIDITRFIRPGANTLALRVQDDTAVKDIRKRRTVAMLDNGKGAIHGHHAGVLGGAYIDRRPPAHAARVRIRTSTRCGDIQVETWLTGTGGAAEVSHAVYAWPDGSQPVLEMPATCMAAGKTNPDAHIRRMAWPDPELWSPARPNLYVLRTTVCAAGRSETIETRFGFREFWIEGRQFMLNGKPIRLFGDAGGRPELRSLVPSVARAYARQAFEFLKQHFNYMSARLHRMIHPVWAIEAADEAGVLIMQQSGIGGGARVFYQNGGETLMRNLEREFAEWYWRDVNSPAVVIWDIENEVIRGQRGPELMDWVLRLDTFIKNLDPRAITSHSGAAWYHPEQQIVHVHMQEQYSRILRDWHAAGSVPLVMGEFWVGGNGETRLPNSCEYTDREDWHREEARLYRERMLEMRYYGACGILPHRLIHWPLLKAGPILSHDRSDQLGDAPYRWRFETVRAEGARGMAPVAGFVWPRTPTVVAGASFTREIVVCNDGEDTCDLRVVCSYGGRRRQWDMTLGPAEQQRKSVRLTAAAGDQGADLAPLTVEVRDAAGRLLESDRIEMHVLPRKAVRPPSTRRRVIVVPAADAGTAAALAALNVRFDTSAVLPDNAAETIVLVPENAADDALGSDAAALRRYLQAGGRLLALAQDKPPRWLPLELPFWSAARTSVPTYTGAGWAPTNKDLNFTSAAPVYAPGHPAFAHLNGADFNNWHPVDGRLSDDAFIRPNALGVRAGGAYRVLLGATRREVASMVEHRNGKGTAVFCQAQVLRAREHPAARTLFYNLLQYLDGDAWIAPQEMVGLLGDLTPKQLSKITGMARGRFAQVVDTANAPDLILAGDHADTGMLHALAGSGRRVLVLSTETCGRLPGYRVENDPEGYYSGTRAGHADHPVFWGVSGAGFLPLEQTPVKGALAALPADARVLLGGHARGHSPFRNSWDLDIGFYGLEARDPAPPLAAVQTIGQGECIATTLEPWDDRSETHRQMLVTLLANAGVDVPAQDGRPGTVEIRHTIPLEFDGRLDDWTNDTDDINISRYSHAQPIPLGCGDRVSGAIKGDLDLSGVVYLLHDARNLYLGGILFSTAAAILEVVLDGVTVRIDPGRKAVAVDGVRFKPAAAAFGSQPAAGVIDTRLLKLMRINNQGQKAEACLDTNGRTFELAVPWKRLGKAGVPEKMTARTRIVRDDGAVLQAPHPDAGEAAVLDLVIRASTLPDD